MANEHTVCSLRSNRKGSPLLEELDPQVKVLLEQLSAGASQQPAPRMVKKLRLLKGGSVPTYLVLDRCCTTGLPWTLE